MGRKLKNLAGQKFGKLTILNDYRRDKGLTYWLCRCDCGDSIDKYIQYNNLKSGSTVSCGCIRDEIDINKKHGYAGTRIYTIWKNMIRRCINPKNSAYPDYGGRGIKVCSEWLIEDNDEGLRNFVNWANTSGYEDNLTIDRIDVDGDYEPCNCKWSTYQEQMNNKRNNVYIEINGTSKTLAEWARFSELPLKRIHSRISRGWKGQDIIKPITERVAKKQSGISNIHWYEPTKRWAVKIQKNHLGYYTELENAIKAKEKYFENNK